MNTKFEIDKIYSYTTNQLHEFKLQLIDVMNMMVDLGEDETFNNLNQKCYIPIQTEIERRYKIN